MLRRRMGVPGAALGGVGAGAIAGFILSSLLLGGIAAIAVFLFSAFGGFGGGGGRALADVAVRSFFQAAGAAEAEAVGVVVAVAGVRAVAAIFLVAAAEAAGDTTCLLTS